MRTNRRYLAAYIQLLKTQTLERKMTSSSVISGKSYEGVAGFQKQREYQQHGRLNQLGYLQQQKNSAIASWNSEQKA